MKRKRLILLAVVAVLAALWTARYVTWNRYLEDTYGLLARQYFQVGERVELGENYMSAYTPLASSYSLTALEANIMSYEDYCQLYGLENNTGLEGEQILELICDVSCDGPTGDGVSFRYCMVHGASWFLNIEGNLLYQLYGDSLYVDDGDTVQVTLPFSVSPLEVGVVPAGQDSYLLLSHFPVQQEIRFDWPA